MRNHAQCSVCPKGTGLLVLGREMIFSRRWTVLGFGRARSVPGIPNSSSSSTKSTGFA